MRGLLLVIVSALAAAPLLAQSGGTAQGPEAAADSLPVRRVVLYKTGVGYFEHRGRVNGTGSVAIRFTSAQLNDVVKSLTALDLGNGRITGISYNSAEPLDRRMSALRLPVGQQATLPELLAALRGARVEIAAGGAPATGRLLSVERQRRQIGTNGGAVDVDVVSVLTDGGELRTFEVDTSLRVRVLERELRQEIGQYLDLVGSARDQDARRMVIRSAGTGARELFVSYVSEVPVWKTTYRLVLPETGAPFLQGWAIVDNTIGEDWRDVQLSLVAGAPQTFIQEIARPYYTQRPVVPLPETALLAPQTHAATLASGPGTLAGVVTVAGGGMAPGVRVRARSGGRSFSTVTDASGRYQLQLPAGRWQIDYELEGFHRATVDDVHVEGGITREQDVELALGPVTDPLTVEAERPVMVPGGVVGGRVGGLPAPPPPPAAPAQAMRDMAPVASAGELGDLFEYRIQEPVTIAKNQSALVPILNAPVQAERVSLWSQQNGSGRPLRAVWLTNSSTLTLDGGTFSVVEADAFAGEGLLDPLEPGERRLLSYAADLGVLVSAEPRASATRVVRVRARDGIVTQESEERAATLYRLRNEDATARVMVIEHPRRPGWQLSGGPEPAETTAGARRFRVAVEPKREVTLEVREHRTTDARVSLLTFTDSVLKTWVAGGLSAAELENALGPVLEKRREVTRLSMRLSTLEQERTRLFADQERLRENLKALGRSSEERSLVQRYTRQLEQQETRLEALDAEMAAARQERERADQELRALIGKVNFEIGNGE